MPCMVSSFDATFFSFTGIVVEAVHTAGKVDNLINAFPQEHEFIYNSRLLITCRLKKREH